MSIILQDYNFSYYSLLREPHLVAHSASSASASASSNSTGDSVELSRTGSWELPEVEDEEQLGPWDSALVWMRFVHFALVPALVFAVHKVKNINFTYV